MAALFSLVVVLLRLGRELRLMRFPEKTRTTTRMKMDYVIWGIITMLLLSVWQGFRTYKHRVKILRSRERVHTKSMKKF